MKNDVMTNCRFLWNSVPMNLFCRCHFVLVIILVVGLNSCQWNPHYQIKTETVNLKSTDRIVLIAKALVKPVLYTHVSGLEKLPVEEGKEKFISAMLPSILKAKYQIHQDRERISRLRDKTQWNKTDSVFYFKNRSQYRAKDVNDLIARMKTLPTSIVLAQAAIESGWGKSRIFTRANNVFGVWSFNSHEPRIAALVKRGNKRIYLRSYTDISYSVTNYFEIIGRAKPFEKLREALMQTKDPLVIVPYLKNYSEQRTAYTKQLAAVIVKNDLMKYDRYILHPAYLIAED